MNARPCSTALAVARAACGVAAVLVTALPAVAQSAQDQAPTTVEPGAIPSEGPSADDAAPPPAAAGELGEGDGVDDWTDLFTEGEFDLNLRLRYEFADADGFDESNAFTLRTRIGFATAPVGGLSGYVALHDSRPLDYSLYNAAGLNGQPGKTVIADPRDGGLDQLYVKWVLPAELTGDVDTGLQGIVGRQRIVLDDARFVGNVGWRNLEQTYDAGVAKWDATGDFDGLEVFYAYVNSVNRIFGPEADRDFDSNSHLANASYDFGSVGKLTGFAYLLDFDNAAGLSSQTYGVRFAGKQLLNRSRSDLELAYVASYARQSDFADNPIDYSANYVLAEATLRKPKVASVGVGYELLGSDDGTAAFQTPLATAHKFNGFADVFVTVPAAGLNDLYATVGATLPWEVDAKATVHLFFADDGGDSYGQEIDVTFGKQVNEHVSLLLKGAHFIGDDLPDVTRLWAQIEFEL